MGKKYVASPPRAVLTLNVGVTGHRFLERADSDLLSQRIREIAEEIGSILLEIHKNPETCFAENTKPCLRVISPLAEGADRIVAREILGVPIPDLRTELQCPLPFSREEYEKDFSSAASKSEYRELLERAGAVFELDGSRQRQDYAYREAGLMVLGHSDLLIGIWDGRPPRYRGGTGDILEEATRMGIPVLWVHSESPHYIYSGIQRKETDWKRALRGYLENLLLPPCSKASGESGHEPRYPHSYFAEKQKKWNTAWVYSFLVNGIGKSRFVLPRLRVGDFEASASAEWDACKEKLPGLGKAFANRLEPVKNSYCRHYAWADGLAVHYAGLYRSSYVLRYIFGALSVIAVALGFYATGWLNWFGFSVQGVLLISIILLSKFGNARCWQQRFIDYRLLAEMIRQTELLSLVGRVMPSVRVPAYNKHADTSWINWHYRAIIREAGLIQAKMDSDYLRDFKRFLGEYEIGGQIAFYSEKALLFERIATRLERIGMSFFYMGLAAILLRIIPYALKYFYSTTHGSVFPYTAQLATGITVMNMLSLLIPGFAPTFFGIRSQGEFFRISRRYEAMKARLEEIRHTLEDGNSLTYDRLSAAVLESAESMVNEVSDWRILLKAKALSFT